ncbi:MAG TPA: tRNA pseudouridine(55) synthase TruB [Bacteroidales bacterium]|nr:tRNA pseudouridine(55) synthase TruB [Bacteroidales bacterium]
MTSGTGDYFSEGQILAFDKPLHWTSFDLVNKIRIMIRSAMGIRKIKVGHAGTLDPLAEGLMIICTGSATKKIDEFFNLEKEYVATIQLGKTTPSFDLETEVDSYFETAHITKEMVEETLMKFKGETFQLPPLYSAKFIEGKRAYEFARKGVEKKLDPVKIVISEMELIEFNLPVVKVRLVCSKGTYIRSFARDLGQALGSGAHLTALKRTAIGKYRVEDALNLEKFALLLEQLKQV